MMKIRTFALMLVSSLGLMAGGLDGKWSATVPTPGREVDAVYEFKVTDGKITGSVTADHGTATITEGTVHGDDVAFVVSAENNGEERKFKHTGKLSGDTLDLKIDFGGQMVIAKLKRVS